MYQNLIKDVYHMMNCVLGTASLANHSSFFCPLTLRGGLGRRPLPPIVFPHLQYDVSQMSLLAALSLTKPVLKPVLFSGCLLGFCVMLQF